MSELTKKLVDLVSPGPSGSDIRLKQTPENYRPRSEIDETGGFLISSPRLDGTTADSKEMLLEANLNPEEWVVTSVRKSRWQIYNGEWLESYRLNLIPVGIANLDKLDVEALCSQISKWKPTKAVGNVTGELSYMVVVSDQQIGKRVGDSGSAEIVNRILLGIDGSVERIKELRKINRKIGTIVLALPGDHVEGIVSQNGKLQGQAASDLGITEQVRVGRRLLLAQIKALAPLCEELIVPVVNGNHDESTRQVVADASDGWNTEIASSVQDICAESAFLSHVKFRFPAKSHQTLAVDINGVMLGLFHGHQAGNNSNAIEKYLDGQSGGQTALGGCDLWVSGHYHNFRTMDYGNRFWAQAPTLDGGSDWYRDKTGKEAHPGMLTMVIGRDYDPRRDISVIKTPR
jgi:predicted phosphodiesterase